MSSVFRFVCGNYGGYVEPTAAQTRDPKVFVYQMISILDSGMKRGDAL